MSDMVAGSQGVDARAHVIERHSIDHVPASERHGVAWHQGPFWFTGAVVLPSMLVGFAGPGLGLAPLWSFIAVVIGMALGTAFMALHANQGPRLGLPQMIQSRAQFGSIGAVFPLLVAVFIYLGYNVFGFIVTAEAIKVVAPGATDFWIVVFAILAIMFSLAGHDFLHFFQRWSSYLAIVVFAILTIMAVDHYLAGGLHASGHRFTVAGFMVQFTVATGYQISYAIYVSDYTRYLPENASARGVIGWTFWGGFIGAAWPAALGVIIASYTTVTDPVVAVHSVGNLLFPGFGVVASGAVSLIIAVFLPSHYLGSFNTFLAILAYLTIPWSAVNLADGIAASVGGQDSGGRSPRRTVPGMIDTHHHLWDLSVREQRWLAEDQSWATAEELAPLRRSFTVADLEAVAVPSGITGTVVVHVLYDPAQTADLLAIAGEGGLVQAVVGWADLTAPDVGGQIAACRELPGGGRLAGIRHPLLAEPDPGWLARPAVRSGLRELGADGGLCFDLTLFQHQLPLAVETARSVPSLTFVLSHLGNPPAGGDDDGSWAASIADLGRLENVVCKLSGAHTEPVSATRLRPYFDAALAAFGPSRLMFGSDWPVSSLAAPYHEIAGMYRDLIAGLSGDEQHAILDGTARQVYRLEAPSRGQGEASSKLRRPAQH